MLNNRVRDWLDGFRQDIFEIQSKRQEFAASHQALLLAVEPLDEKVELDIARLRGLAIRAIEKGPFALKGLDAFLQYSIVNAHDAAAEALACIYSGSGAPSAALLRRLFELCNLLTAAWYAPVEFADLMREALGHPYQDDRYAKLAASGLVGSVMPSPYRIRHLAFGTSDDVLGFERGLNTFAHGGAMSAVFYLSDTADGDQIQKTVELSSGFAHMAKDAVGMASVSASMVAQRIGLDMTPPVDVYGLFRPHAVEGREDRAMRDFDRVFPNAVDALWSACLAVGSITSETAEVLGPREHDPVRHQHMILSDGLESIWLATELIFRGRLNAGGTVLRRAFELSLEGQGWAQHPSKLIRRFSTSRGQKTAPAALWLITQLHGTRDSANQRQTYSTLCSIAHGGAQSVEYLTDGDYPKLRIQPAPTFIESHHRWLTGTLFSATHALLGSALIIGDRIKPGILRNYGGHLDMFTETLAMFPTLIRHEEAKPEPGYENPIAGID